MARQHPSAGAKTQVFLVDDEPSSAGVCACCWNWSRTWRFCGEADSEDGAFDGIAELCPHLAVVDMSFEGGDGLSLISGFTRFVPR